MSLPSYRPPPWSELRPRFEAVVFRTSVTRVARMIYGEAGPGAEQTGRRSIYNWLGKIEPTTLCMREVWRVVQQLEAELGIVPACAEPAGGARARAR